MHTPRFSGQPINAGDFVFTWTFSRPMRTNCENVGTVSSSMRPHGGRQLRVENFCPQAAQNRVAKGAAPAKRADKNARERTAWLKGLLRIRRNPQQETPHAFQKAELFFWLRFGEAHSALRGWRPIPAALLSHSVVLCSGTEDIPSNYTYRVTNIPDKQRSIRKTP